MTMCRIQTGLQISVGLGVVANMGLVMSLVPVGYHVDLQDGFRPIKLSVD